MQFCAELGVDSAPVTAFCSRIIDIGKRDLCAMPREHACRRSPRP